MEPAPPDAPPPSLREAVEVWAAIAGQSIGSPAAQIGVLHRTLVVEKRWIGEARFLRALNVALLLPGPEVQQLLIYVGWLSHGWRGGLLAGWLFVLPGFGAILGASLVYAHYHAIPAVAAGLFGLAAAVLAVVFEAALRLARRVLDRPSTAILALAAFVALVLRIPFPVVIGLSALVGAVLPSRFPPPPLPAASGAPTPRPWLDARLDADALPHVRPSPRRDLGIALLLVGVWLAPTALLWASLGPDATFTRIGRLFSTSALMTFGSAYAVLGHVAHRAVEVHPWLGPNELAAGLGLASTAPGPLVHVFQFVGTQAAFRDPGVLSPSNAAILGALLTAWATFWPSFLFVLAGGPYLEALPRIPRLASALRAITASGVGAVASLALWLAVHLWFGTVNPVGWRGLGIPDPATVRPLGIGITLVAAVAVYFRLPMTVVLLAGVLLGLLSWLAS